MRPAPELPARSLLWLVLLFVPALTGCAGDLADSGAPDAVADVRDATFVGRQVCAPCHQEQEASWRGSHHDLAMQEATEETVLGDFSDATFTYAGVTSTFFRREGGFWVETDGPDGELRDYEIAYVFGVEPLQQYLVGFPDGRYQALSVVWDARPREEGGQRWYHLYPGEEVDHRDSLHWTGVFQNWNQQCAECHSTDRQKGYDPASDSYRSTWSEIDVSCEACHGPGSRHAAWTEKVEAGEILADGPNGLVLDLRDRSGGVWEIDAETGIAERSAPPSSRAEIEACARCHARRSPIVADYQHGSELLDTHRLSLLEENLYWADGHIRDEVYVYGSFVQSRMYSKGVTCGDCHDPHGLTIASPDQARALSSAGEIRRSVPPLPPGRLRRVELRRVPHAVPRLHGGRLSPRPRLPDPASRSLGLPRHSQPVQRLPSGPLRRVGGGSVRGAIRRRCLAASRLRHRP